MTTLILCLGGPFNLELVPITEITIEAIPDCPRLVTMERG